MGDIRSSHRSSAYSVTTWIQSAERREVGQEEYLRWELIKEKKKVRKHARDQESDQEKKKNR